MIQVSRITLSWSLIFVQMVKSKSAGYICPSLKEKKVHRFSLAEESLNDDAGSSLLTVDSNYSQGK